MPGVSKCLTRAGRHSICEFGGSRWLPFSDDGRENRFLNMLDSLFEFNRRLGSQGLPEKRKYPMPDASHGAAAAWEDLKLLTGVTSGKLFQRATKRAAGQPATSSASSSSLRSRPLGMRNTPPYCSIWFTRAV